MSIVVGRDRQKEPTKSELPFHTRITLTYSLILWVTFKYTCVSQLLQACDKKNFSDLYQESCIFVPTFQHVDYRLSVGLPHSSGIQAEGVAVS